ncbi:hypothetical protein GGR53DRAFT_502244 [Hypoxylon sp. FL1150]|nr:hypothetical protein GGR53DRAFT_502244 [Hypoxylon sp. FL1150]
MVIMSFNPYIPFQYLPAIEDVSSPVNKAPVLPPSGLKAAGQPVPVPAALPVPATNPAPAAVPVPAVKPTPKATNGRKRKSETTSLEDDIAAYKQNLEHVSTEDMSIDWTCNQVRGKINRIIDSGIMKKGEFCKAIHCSSSGLSTFLSKRGSMEGENSSVYTYAWHWFKQREIAGLKMPDVKKRQKTEAVVAAVDSSSDVAAVSGSKTGRAAAPQATEADINNVQLPGEETDEVPVFDTCDEIRRKINAHIKTPGLTAAQFCRDIYAQLHMPAVKCFQSKSLNDFRGKRGPNAGCTSRVFYAAYVYFEKKRIAEGKPRSQHRIQMESIWPDGFDLEHDGRAGVTVFEGERPTVDQYGQLHIERIGRSGFL